MTEPGDLHGQNGSIHIRKQRQELNVENLPDHRSHSSQGVARKLPGASEEGPRRREDPGDG